MSLYASSEQTQELMKVALGEAEADLAIINVSIVNVYTGEMLTGNTVLTKKERIAYVGKDAGKSIGASTQVIDASGKVLIPGFIDGHTHIANKYSVSELLRYALKGGTTTIITECAEMAFPLGYRGIIYFLQSLKNQPAKIFITVPPMVSISPAVKAITVKELRKLLKREEVVGLGEPYWAQVVGGDRHVLDLIGETVKAGKKAEGHSAGARDRKLQAYTATGISSCHEPVTADEVIERLRLGLSILIREGEIRRELEAIAPIKDKTIDFRKLAIATDGLGPWQLTTNGYMEFIVQKAINLGFNPITAVQMATLNVAQHLNLDNFIGGIAPGKFADIVVIPDLHTIKPEYVISNGQVAVKDGQLTVKPREHRYPGPALRTINLPRDLAASDFTIRADSIRQQVKITVIDQVTSLVTKEALIDVPVSDGQIRIDTDKDIIKVAAIDRTYQPGKTFTGLIRGIGLKHGAIADSAAWDTTDIIVVGASESDMAQAVNRVKKLNGGIVVCAGNKVLAELALPVGGVFGNEPMEVISQKLHAIQRAAAGLGCPLPDICTTMVTLTSGAIPYLRICEQGLFNLKEKRFVELIVD